jgi:transcriptional regulator with XRE-family HTH domain
LSFYYESSDRSLERERIGAKIRLLREKKGMEAKQLAIITNIDAANLSRIEQGKYSVGLDILSKISLALGAKVDLVEI